MGWSSKPFGRKKPELAINKVKYLGVRTTQETNIMTTYNYSMYCFLVELEDETREIREYRSDDPKLKEIIMYIDMD